MFSLQPGDFLGREGVTGTIAGEGSAQSSHFKSSSGCETTLARAPVRQLATLSVHWRLFSPLRGWSFNLYLQLLTAGVTSL